MSSSRLLTAQLRRKQQSRLRCYVGDDPEVTPVAPYLGGEDGGGVGDRVRIGIAPELAVAWFRCRHSDRALAAGRDGELRSSRISAATECVRAPGGQSRTTSHAIHHSFTGQAVEHEDLLVAPNVDRVGQLTEDLTDEFVRVPRTT